MHIALKIPLYFLGTALAIGAALSLTATVGFALWWISTNLHPLWTILASTVFMITAYNLIDWFWTSYLDPVYLEPIRKQINQKKIAIVEKKATQKDNHVDLEKEQATQAELLKTREQLEKKQLELVDEHEVVKGAERQIAITNGARK
jgi:hypothetical protein